MLFDEVTVDSSYEMERGRAARGGSRTGGLPVRISKNGYTGAVDAGSHVKCKKWLCNLK